MRNNRRAGHGYELEIATLLRESGLFPHIATSRSENRQRDGEKVDLVNRSEGENGRLEYNIQCKNSHQRPDYHELLSSMPQLEGIINVILHKYTRKAGQRFQTQGRYALMSQEDFITLMKFRKAYEILSPLLDVVDSETRTAAESLLDELNL